MFKFLWELIKVCISLIFTVWLFLTGVIVGKSTNPLWVYPHRKDVVDKYIVEAEWFINLVKTGEDEYPEHLFEATKATAEPKATSAKASRSERVTPDFKEIMDSYEMFFDTYIEFMDKYENLRTRC